MLAKAAAAAWLAALVAALYAVTGLIAPSAAAEHRLLEPAPLSRLDTRLIDIVTLGNRGLYDDIGTIWTLQMLVDERLKEQNPQEVLNTIRTLTRHNPKIESLYMLSCFALALDLQSPDKCEPITLDGLKALPESWRIPVTQGFMGAYKLNDPKMAAMYYGLAASRPDAPPFLAKLSQNLVAKNALDAGELQETMTHLLGAQQGSRLGELLEKRGGGKAGP